MTFLQTLEAHDSVMKKIHESCFFESNKNIEIKITFFESKYQPKNEQVIFQKVDIQREKVSTSTMPKSLQLSKKSFLSSQKLFY